MCVMKLQSCYNWSNDYGRFWYRQTWNFFYRTQYLRTWAALGNLLMFGQYSDGNIIAYNNSLRTVGELVVLES